MPFAYFGGKRRLAPHYPPPAERTIIEPFAGGAGYSLQWATPEHRVILIEKDPAVCALWRRLQAPGALEDVLTIRCPPPGATTDEPLIMLCSGGDAIGGRVKPTDLTDPKLGVRPCKVTTRMSQQWPTHQKRYAALIPIITNWQLLNIGYEQIDAELGNQRATWFIDPPYWVPTDAPGTRGDGYRMGADGIDFDHLAAWCRARRGQVIVCEQEGATWLPFRPLRMSMTNNTTDTGQRLEVVWSRTPGRMISSARATDARSAASTARSARRTRTLS